MRIQHERRTGRDRRRPEAASISFIETDRGWNPDQRSKRCYQIFALRATHPVKWASR
jgi:hypothetical protein